MKRIALPYSLRVSVLAGTAGICQCGCGRVLNGVEFHHLVPIAYGGENSLANIRAVTPECHKRLTRSFVKAHSKVKRIEKQAQEAGGDVLSRIESALASRSNPPWWVLRKLLEDAAVEIESLRWEVTG